LDLQSRSLWQAGYRDGEPKLYTKGLNQMQRKIDLIILKLKFKWEKNIELGEGRLWLGEGM